MFKNPIKVKKVVSLYVNVFFGGRWLTSSLTNNVWIFDKELLKSWDDLMNENDLRGSFTTDVSLIIRLLSLGSVFSSSLFIV